MPIPPRRGFAGVGVTRDFRSFLRHVEASVPRGTALLAGGARRRPLLAALFQGGVQGSPPVPVHAPTRLAPRHALHLLSDLRVALQILCRRVLRGDDTGNDTGRAFQLMLGPACSPLTANTASVPMLRAFFMRPAATGSRAAQFSYVSVLLADGRLN